MELSTRACHDGVSSSLALSRCKQLSTHPPEGTLVPLTPPFLPIVQGTVSVCLPRVISRACTQAVVEAWDVGLNLHNTKGQSAPLVKKSPTRYLGIRGRKIISPWCVRHHSLPRSAYHLNPSSLQISTDTKRKGTDTQQRTPPWGRVENQL